MTRTLLERFHGRILGAGSSSGLRLVVGDWWDSPLGAFTDVMVATHDDRRVLLAPDHRVAQYVAATYSFDEVRVCPVILQADDAAWRLDAGPLRCTIGLGARTAIGLLLRPVPERMGRSRAFEHLADPIARRLLPGVRTVGSSRQRCVTRPIWPASRSVPALMATRSLLSVVVATRHPSPTLPTRLRSGTRTPERKTSLNSASPVIWRRGRTSTPGSVMSTRK